VQYDDTDFTNAASSPAGASAGEAWTVAREIAPLALDVLIEGESGAGKDVLAREIHKLSRRHGKYVAINCAAIPDSIAESELFGYEVGAFTGASRSKEGKLEVADKGTLYLDEIDSMPLASQAKLLRALQERGAERLGGSKFYRSDFRVIASTKVPLAELVRQGKFRLDLYYRLNVVTLRLPALRNAPDRILQLFTSFLEEACERHGRAVPAIGSALRRQLMEHRWPGNIRELRNAAERHAIGIRPIDDEIDPGLASPASAPDCPDVGAADRLSLRDRLKFYERDVIGATLKSCGGSVARASKLLQVPSNTLYYRIKTLGLADPESDSLPQ
jgi:transcriptional regulator with PAS, ATPase and Fis domain